MQLRQRVLGHIQRYPGKTASQIAKALKERPGVVASCLISLFRAGMVDRTDGLGPRGGMGYTLASERKTWHERLLAEADTT